MSATPFIRPIQNQGGTFYTFSSAAEDLEFTFNTINKKFYFSKFACLNLPDIKRPESDYALLKENYIQLDVIPGAFGEVSSSKTYNNMLAESLQNYVFNLETMITSRPEYQSDKLLTVSERVFFKWLKELGAIRFREATSQEKNSGSYPIFVEEDESSLYSRVVKYIGDIDMVNSVKLTNDSFTEIYINIPNEHGNTPLICFRSISDENYFPGLSITNHQSNPNNDEIIYNRSHNDTHPYSLSLQAFFDSDLNSYGDGIPNANISIDDINPPSEGYQLFKYNKLLSNYYTGWWFSQPDSNTYFIQQPYDLNNPNSNFDSCDNDSLLIRGVRDDSHLPITLQYIRTQLDGICIDFDINDYKPITSNNSIKSLSDFNSLNTSTSFDFNTILIYYTVEDISTGEKKNNLFGVLFLDKVTTSTDGSYIKRYKKYKPDTVLGLNGNSYGFKINIKFDVSNDNASVVSVVNEYSTFSMHMFTDALSKLQKSSDILLNQTYTVNKLNEEIENIKGLLLNDYDKNEIKNRLSIIENQLSTSKIIFENVGDLTSLIEKNYQEILNIYNNKTSVNVAYNLDIIQPSSGISIDNSINNKLYIKNTMPSYNLSTKSVFDISSDFVLENGYLTLRIELNEFNNYIKIKNENDFNVQNDIKILIIDDKNKWKSGQSFKISFDYNFPLDLYTDTQQDLYIYTDFNDTINSGNPFSLEIAYINSDVFKHYDGHPIIEIICVYPNFTINNNNFIFDIL